MWVWLIDRVRADGRCTCNSFTYRGGFGGRAGIQRPLSPNTRSRGVSTHTYMERERERRDVHGKRRQAGRRTKAKAASPFVSAFCRLLRTYCAGRLASPVLSTPATRVSARRPRRPRRARMARRSSGAFPAGCAGQSASLRAPPPLWWLPSRPTRRLCRRGRQSRLPPPPASPPPPSPAAARTPPKYLPS